MLQYKWKYMTNLRIVWERKVRQTDRPVAPSGYYYRVILTHYAKEDTWFFPDKQTMVQ